LLNTIVDGVEETKIVAFEDRSFVGTVGLQYRGRVSARFRQLYVAPESRLHGIGRRLVDCCCLIADSAGCESIALQVTAKNRGLVEDFYSQLGFIVSWEFSDGDLMLFKALVKRDSVRMEGGAK
jgi:GNAT superfamily N-acetyltransferase